MDFLENATEILLLQENLSKTSVIYLKSTPEILDFTRKQEAKITIFGPKTIEFTLNSQNTKHFASLLESLNDKVNLICWNIKSLLSYLRFFNKKFPSLTCKILDLQIIERILGTYGDPPINYVEACNRIKKISEELKWKMLYKQVYLPLLKVLSGIEVNALLDDKSAKYSYYEIEGQVNGRLKCSESFAKSFNPHTLGNIEKEVLRPREKVLFVSADIKCCEIYVLQYLSKDKRLKEIIDSKLDVYEEIWKCLSNDKENTREKCKKTFLPIIYGCGGPRLANILSIDENKSYDIINRVNNLFPEAINYVWSLSKKAEEGWVENIFGKRRYFKDKFYLARDFAIQSVASVLCLEKLIELSKKVDLCMNIHDAFVTTCPKSDAKFYYDTFKTVLESESVLCPELSFKCEIQFGPRLNRMKKIG